MAGPINFRKLSPQKLTDMLNPNKTGLFLVKLGNAFYKIEKGVVKEITDEDVPSFDYSIQEMNTILNPNKVGSLQVILQGGKLYQVEKGKKPTPVLDNNRKPVVVK